MKKLKLYNVTTKSLVEVDVDSIVYLEEFYDKVANNYRTKIHTTDEWKDIVVNFTEKRVQEMVDEIKNSVEDEKSDGESTSV